VWISIEFSGPYEEKSFVLRYVTFHRQNIIFVYELSEKMEDNHIQKRIFNYSLLGKRYTPRLTGMA